MTEEQEKILANLVNAEILLKQNTLLSVVEIISLAKNNCGFGISEDKSFTLPSCLDVSNFIKKSYSDKLTTNGLCIFVGDKNDNSSAN
jgi:hypothetical protein